MMEMQNQTNVQLVKQSTRDPLFEGLNPAAAATDRKLRKRWRNTKKIFVSSSFHQLSIGGSSSWIQTLKQRLTSRLFDQLKERWNLELLKVLKNVFVQGAPHFLNPRFEVNVKTLSQLRAWGRIYIRHKSGEEACHLVESHLVDSPPRLLTTEQVIQFQT